MVRSKEEQRRYQREYQRWYRSRTPEEIAETERRSAEWRHLTPGQRKKKKQAVVKAWFKKHPEYQREYRERNHAKVLEKERRWREKNKEKRRARARDLYRE